MGETCLGKIHKSDYVNVNKTYLCLIEEHHTFNLAPVNLLSLGKNRLHVLFITIYINLTLCF